MCDLAELERRYNILKKTFPIIRFKLLWQDSTTDSFCIVCDRRRDKKRQSIRFSLSDIDDDEEKIKEFARSLMKKVFDFEI